MTAKIAQNFVFWHHGTIQYCYIFHTLYHFCTYLRLIAQYFNVAAVARRKFKISIVRLYCFCKLIIIKINLPKETVRFFLLFFCCFHKIRLRFKRSLQLIKASSCFEIEQSIGRLLFKQCLVNRQSLLVFPVVEKSFAIGNFLSSNHLKRPPAHYDYKKIFHPLGYCL
ncbi:MAG: hypothetical protein BWX65_00028 [Bacteroidetes bacterium ADurb.Bin057]|nr:MAG: hypothetical protein BWX65_00028 [Bacteroidetes bacterium ADurb.Bin057]